MPRSIAILGLLSASVLAQPQLDHVYNPHYQVKAYELTRAEETSFNTLNGVASPFWSAWGVAGAKLDSVYVDGLDNYTYGDSAQSAGEGNATLKIAYGVEGVYFLIEVQDDSWAGYIDWLDYSNDAVVLWGNKFSAEELYGPDTDTLLPCLARAAQGFPAQVNYYHLYVEIRFGADTIPQHFTVEYWNPALMDASVYGCSPGCSGSGVYFYNRDMSFAQAVSTFGIEVDVLAAEGDRRRQEWLIPWKSWGGPNGPPVTKRALGQKLAMCFGYNDLDPGAQAHHTAMRWRNADPFSICNVATTPPCSTSNSYDAWGDIVFDIGLDEAVARAGVRDVGLFARRSPRVSPVVRYVNGRLEVAAAGLDPRDRILVTDARGSVVMTRDAGEVSGTVLSWQAPRSGVYQVRVGNGLAGTIAVR